MLKKCVKIISVFLCAVLIFQSLEIGIFATTEQTEETTPEDEIFCLCENCTEYECSCECETEEACTCVQCKRTAYTEYDDFGNVIAEKSFDGTKTLVSEQVGIFGRRNTAFVFYRFIGKHSILHLQ